MEVNFKKLHKNAITPIYSQKNDACLDLYVADIEFEYKEEDNISLMIIDSGIAFEIPKDCVGLLFSRSSICNYNLIQSNGVGVIESDYRDSVKIKFRYKRNIKGKKYCIGDRFGQIMIIPRPKISLVEVDQLSETERGEGGFGSSGT